MATILPFRQPMRSFRASIDVLLTAECIRPPLAPAGDAFEWRTSSIGQRNNSGVEPEDYLRFHDRGW
jgi:hypothetical protein